MKRSILMLALVVFLLAGTAGGALAAGTGFGHGSHEICIREILGEDQLQVFEEIIATFRAEMEALRDKIAALRGSGDREALAEAFKERDEIRTRRYEALVELLPEEYSERFTVQGRGGRHHGQDEGKMGFRGWQSRSGGE